MSDPTAFRIQRSTALIAVAGALVQVAATVPIPFLVRDIFADILDSETGGTQRIAILGAIIVVLQIAGGAAAVFLRRAVARSTAQYGTELRAWVHRMFTRRKLAALDEVDDATLLHHAITLPGRAEEGANVLVASALPAALVASVTTVVLFIIEWRMALILVITFPILSVTQQLSRRRMRASNRARSNAESDLSRLTLSTIVRSESVRTTAAIAAEEDRQRERSDVLRQTHESLALNRALVLTSNFTAVLLSVTVLLLVGAWMIDTERLAVSEFLAFYAGVAILRGPANQIGSAAPSIDGARDARAQLAQLDAALGAETASSGVAPSLSESIELRGLSFSHGEHRVLEAADLRVERGEFVALVGPNGAGKTTLVRLVLGLYEPASGERFVDGVRYEELDLGLLRSKIGVSFQQAELAEATLRDNILYGRDLGQAAIDEAIMLTDLGGVISDLPEGLDTMIGPGGRRLSRGQEQRVALARAVIGRPPMLILDEPTNHLDPSAVSTLLKRLVDLPHRPALVVVSHDHRALERADRVLEVSDGRIVERPIA